MFWVWLSLALVGGLIGGFMVGAKLIGAIAKEGLDQAAKDKASDQDLLMHTFRRELGNWMFRTDPDRYRALYDRARLTEARTLAADPAERLALLKRLASDMPYVADFDFVGSREHVTYSDALSHYSYEEVEEKYLDIVRWQSVQIADNPAWKYRPKPTSDADAEHIVEYTKRLNDTRFKRRLQETMRLYWFARPDAGGAVDNDFFAVRPVHHFAENRYGIHFKDTNEFGVFSVFHDTDRDFESYYRSSPDFTEAHSLDATVAE